MLEGLRRGGRRRDLLVYVDTVSLEWAVGLSVQAARRGIETALVCPPGAAPVAHAFARVVETHDLGAAGLERVLVYLERSWRVCGITTSFGAFRPEGFVQEAVAEAARARSLAHTPPEALYRATNKYLARDALAAAGLPVGRFGLAHDEASALECARRVGLPLVLKPLTGVGSSVILRCSTEQEVVERFHQGVGLLAKGHYAQLRMAAHTARRANGEAMVFDPARSLLAEEYFDGREASVECLIVGDEVVPLVVHDKTFVDERAQSVFEHVLVAPPERFTAEEVRELEDYAVRAVRGLGLRWRMCHVELRYVDGVGPRLLEVNPRIGAGCVLDSIETSWGFDVPDMLLDLVLGRARVPARVPRSTERHAMVFLFSPRSGVLRRLAGLDRVRRLPEVKVVRQECRPGQRVGGDAEESFLASIWLKAADAAAADASYRRILELVEIDVEASDAAGAVR